LILRNGTVSSLSIQSLTSYRTTCKLLQTGPSSERVEGIWYPGMGSGVARGQVGAGAPGRRPWGHRP